VDMNDLNFAHLNADLISQIQQLEKQLRQETHRDIVLLAYEKEGERHVPHP
jgi:hypothetical protein